MISFIKSLFEKDKEIERFNKLIEEKDRRIEHLDRSNYEYYHNQKDYVCENPICLEPYAIKHQTICERCDSAFCSYCDGTDKKTCVLCSLERIKDKDLLDFLIKKHGYVNEEHVKDLYRREKDNYEEPEDFPRRGFCCETSKELAIDKYYKDLKEELHRRHKCNDEDCWQCNWKM